MAKQRRGLVEHDQVDLVGPKRPRRGRGQAKLRVEAAIRRGIEPHGEIDVGELAGSPGRVTARSRTGSGLGDDSPPMGKREDYREALAAAGDREPYLLEHSGLPGPRGNIELAQAAADVCTLAELRRWAKLDADRAPTGTAEEFLTFCGVLGLSRELLDGDAAAIERLRRHAGDPRWRLREAVAMALQRWGEADFDALAEAMAAWARGSWLERRAAAAALCEPVLLTGPDRVATVLDVLAAATAGIAGATAGERRSDEFEAMRKGLGYAWSVAVAAAPELGVPAFERLLAEATTGEDRDLRWIVRENLRKKRLERLDAAWVERSLARL